ncbi:hypothetical protein [Blastococcus mobilis]|uniref:Uncharacterized protein n=1 Tax=Blastococcus mobilis TaxID=1938746 RepID=A0A238VF11_9ACTN|nr:hypothetical protein [Blastococcus mobilis]SNR32992.1 hypothetical protein SAMN06272737_10377 [Blastococcus mobilis]
MSIVITGASDDLIEIDGDITEEFYGNDEDGDLLAFSDGTVLRISYTRSGVWRIVPITTGPGFVGITQAPEGDEDNYTDRAEVTDATWVVHGKAIAR